MNIATKRIFCHVSLAEGRVLKLADEKKSRQSCTVQDKKRKLDQDEKKRRFGRIHEVHDRYRYATARDGKAVTDGEKVNELIEADGAHDCADGE